MRLVYTAAASLAALFAFSDASPIAATLKTVYEPDASLTARGFYGHVDEANSKRLLREANAHKDSNLTPFREERTGASPPAEAAAIAESSGVGKIMDTVLDTAIKLGELDQKVGEKSQAVIDKLEQSLESMIDKTEQSLKSLWNKATDSRTFQKIKAKYRKYRGKFRDIKIGRKSIGERYQQDVRKNPFKNANAGKTSEKAMAEADAESLPESDVSSPAAASEYIAFEDNR